MDSCSRSEDSCGAVKCAGGLSSDRRWLGIDSCRFFGIMSSEEPVSCAESLPFVRRTGVPGGEGSTGEHPWEVEPELQGSTPGKQSQDCRGALLGSRPRALDGEKVSEPWKAG